MSNNHQFIQYSDRVVKRYIRTRNQAVTGYRQDPHRPENRIDFLLMSPESDFDVVWKDGEEVDVVRKNFDYDNEVIELYSDNEVKMFQRWNRMLIENGILTEYSEEAPALDVSNVLSDATVNEIAATKNLLAFRKRLESINSVDSLKRVLSAVENLDRPYSIAKAVQERIRALK